MEVIVFEKEAYYKMLAEIKRSIRDAIKEAKSEVQVVKDEDPWVERKEAEKILKCKRDKLRQLCDEDHITTSRPGRKILYYKPSLYEYLTKKSQHEIHR